MSGTEANQLEFPLDWHGRIIALATDADMAGRIANVLRGFGITAPPTAGTTSRKGRYVTFRVTATFRDRAMMDQVTYALAKIEGVKMVL